MNAALFEPRPLYGIGTVARLTGLKPDTLRVWERRYGLGASHKSATGRRQYTQSDLEHLQLIAALVSDGARIGEIANSERKTLEMLLRQRGATLQGAAQRSKTRAVFVGVSLCEWLDRHQGCISNVDARLARKDLQEITPEALGGIGDIDVLLLEVGSLSSQVVERVIELKDSGVARRVLVCAQYANEHWLQRLEEAGVSTLDFPPDSGKLAFEIAKGMAEADVSVGESNLGDIVGAKPQQYTKEELGVAAQLKSTLDCECPRHISELITALANFEEYSASCSVDNWRDAAVHACIYAYTAQSRHLMEKALSAVLEERREEFETAMSKRRLGAGLSDAA